MEIGEFGKTQFYSGMTAEYKGEEYKIVTVCFEESIIGLLEINEDVTDGFELTYVRCENIEIISYK